MKHQDKGNHIRYYPPHHFVFYPVVMVLIVFCVRQAGKDNGNNLVWWMFAAVLFVVGWLSFMLRQHYALTLQNRIVILEIRLRYYRLTQQAFENIESQLSFEQMAALRFAPDEELLPLIESTLKEKLSPQAIKSSIKNWLPDYRRV
jgi:hypothetical protein